VERPGGEDELVVRHGTDVLHEAASRTACENWLRGQDAAPWRHRDEVTGAEVIRADQWILT
jgi:hypothetical protein